MSMKIKTRAKEDTTEILVAIKHPMESGQAVNPQTKEKIPAHFIQKLTIALNGKTVADVSVGPAVSRDPLFAVAVKGAKKGDKVKVSWSDNKGQKEEGEATVGDNG